MKEMTIFNTGREYFTQAPMIDMRLKLAAAARMGMTEHVHCYQRVLRDNGRWVRQDAIITTRMPMAIYNGK